MTKNLVAFGNLDKPLTLYNRTKTSADDHSSKIGNSQVVATVEEAVKGADIIWSCLQDERAVDAIYRQIFLLDLTGKLFVDSSTIPPEIADAIAKQVIDKGGEYVAMPGLSIPLTIRTTR